MTCHDDRTGARRRDTPEHKSLFAPPEPFRMIGGTRAESAVRIKEVLMLSKGSPS